MRFWRALKAMGCAVLRDGVYLRPLSDEGAVALSELADEIIAAGGSANVITAASRDRDQDDLFRSLFDRTEDFAQITASLTAARKSLSGLSVPEINRLVRRLRREYEALRAIDYFPSDAGNRAQVRWTDFLGLIDTVLSPDEPKETEGAIRRLDRRAYQGKAWATRRHLWVDRVASAWLIRRFIDPGARFLWLQRTSACPKTALGFDFDGAAFTHVGPLVTFQVLVESFRLNKDEALARVGELVQALDVGGPVVAEAGGFEAMMAGASQRSADDDALLAEMTPVLDSLYVFYGAPRPAGRG